MTIALQPNPNSMLLWWPALQDKGLPLPRTEIVKLPKVFGAEELLYACAEHGMECVRERPDSNPWPVGHPPVLQAIWPDVAAAADRIGYPVFLRTDLMSGKHAWRDTCHVPSRTDLALRISSLVEYQAVHMLMQADDALAAFAVRELLEAGAPFSAFDGLPIAREFRYFVENGQVLCRHAYWEDEENIKSGLREEHTDWVGNPIPNDWRVQLREISALGAFANAHLTFLATIASNALPGAWSVDFMLARSRFDPWQWDPRWWLIDMARAEDSWHPAHDETP